jgi:hypothetical protein
LLVLLLLPLVFFLSLMAAVVADIANVGYYRGSWAVKGTSVYCR